LLLVDRLANFHMQAQMPNHIWYFSTSRTHYFLEKIFASGENLKLSKQRVFPICDFS
jgi:AMMECR1 domain-containing protein